MKKIIKVILSIIILAVLGFGALILVLTLTDYNPESVEKMAIVDQSVMQMEFDKTYTIGTWNIGVAALGKDEDFFMDGGTSVRPKSKDHVELYLKNILSYLKKSNWDFSMIQEIDTNSKRSYEVNELDALSDIMMDFDYSFAKNYDVLFVPVPWPPLGHVESGLATFSRYNLDNANRYKFEGNYAWPKSVVMLDRCFLVTELDIPDHEGKLILVNAHFSAYDDGSLREKQLAAIKLFIVDQYNAGNYVVLGGDWNQTFDFIDTKDFPVFQNGEFYMPSVISSDWLDDGWQFAVDEQIPTYRLLSGPYTPGETQIGIIDGFLVSPNVKIESIHTDDLQFQDSDHNPVILTFKLQ